MPEESPRLGTQGAVGIVVDGSSADAGEEDEGATRSQRRTTPRRGWCYLPARAWVSSMNMAGGFAVAGRTHEGECLDRRLAAVAIYKSI